MEKNVIKEEIKDLLKKAKPDAIIPDDDFDLFNPDCHIAPRDMLFVCMELKKSHPIDYNQVVDRVQIYSLNNLSAAICQQIT